MKKLCSLLAAVLVYVPAMAADVDNDAAMSQLKKSECFKCHAIDKKKDGPSYKVVAEKYKGDPTAEAKLIEHATTNPIVEIDGRQEKHKSLRSKDEADIRNVVLWILSR